MKINSLTIKKYNCLNNVTVNFSERATILLGENGSGKSSFIEAICQIFSDLEHRRHLKLIDFDYEINYGRARRTILVFKAGDKTMTLNMYQAGHFDDDECIMNLDVEDNKIDATAEGKIVEIPFETNLVYNLDEMFLTITYPSDQEPEQDWIILRSVEETKVTIEVAPNTTGEDRTAKVKLTHIDAGSLKATEGDPVHSNTLTVVQTL